MRTPYIVEKVPVECPTCRTTHYCAVEGSGIEKYAELETTRCQADDCLTRMCSSCNQSKCTSCDGIFCEAHIYITSGGLVCGVCLKAFEMQDAELAQIREGEAL